MSAVYAVVSFCGQGSLTLWDREPEAREYLALIGNCSPDCSTHISDLWG